MGSSAGNKRQDSEHSEAEVKPTKTHLRLISSPARMGRRSHRIIRKALGIMLIGLVIFGLSYVGASVVFQRYSKRVSSVRDPSEFRKSNRKSQDKTASSSLVERFEHKATLQPPPKSDKAISDGNNESKLKGIQELHLMFPLKGFTLPDNLDLYPGAPRSYRSGYHEGIDLYCPYAIPIHAAAGGRIVWIDTSYKELTLEHRQALLNEARRLGHTPESTLWTLKGRKIVIDHGNAAGQEISTIYAHLSRTLPGLKQGGFVKKGQIIGFAGNSGTSDGIKGTKEGTHLHFEIRIGDIRHGYYLGQSLPPSESKELYIKAFEP